MHWRGGELIPVLKKQGPHSLPGAHRGILLEDHLVKAFYRAIWRLWCPPSWPASPAVSSGLAPPLARTS
eukprot:6619396-Alexandrium_andersonii.AAC.1